MVYYNRPQQSREHVLRDALCDMPWYLVGFCWCFQSRDAHFHSAANPSEYPKIGDVINFDTLRFPFTFTFIIDIEIGKRAQGWALWLRHENDHFLTWLASNWLPRVNALRSGGACMRRWTNLTLVHVMACRLNGITPLSKPLLACCQLLLWGQTPVDF